LGSVAESPSCVEPALQAFTQQLVERFAPEQIILCRINAHFSALIERCSETGLFVGYLPGFPAASTLVSATDVNGSRALWRRLTLGLD